MKHYETKAIEHFAEVIILTRPSVRQSWYFVIATPLKPRKGIS